MPPHVVIHGPFPPPVHGFSIANDAMRAKFIEAGCLVTVIDTAADRASPAGPGGRIRARLRAGLRLASALSRGDCWLYQPVSGGKGQWAELLAVLLARLLGRRIVLHHHSFSYLNRFSGLASLLFLLAGRPALHIVLCSRMGTLLSSLYPSAGRVAVLSNAALTAIEARPPDAGAGRMKIGFLSNITLEKGIDRFAAAYAELRRLGLAVDAVIAGPVAEASARPHVDRAIADGAVYLGPVHGEDKAAFFQRIDVLLFPTRYPNEAEPFVILEALACAVPVVATRRGCIESLIDESCGLLLDAQSETLSPAVEKIGGWIADPGSFAAARRAAADRFAEIGRGSEASLHRILGEIVKT